MRTRMLRAADVLLMPYRVDTYKERTSGVFCEALSAGKPVIVSQGSLMGLQNTNRANRLARSRQQPRLVG